MQKRSKDEILNLTLGTHVYSSSKRLIIIIIWLDTKGHNHCAIKGKAGKEPSLSIKACLVDVLLNLIFRFSTRIIDYTMDKCF